MKKQFFLLAVTFSAVFFLHAQTAQQASFKTSVSEVLVSKAVTLPKAVKNFYAANPKAKDAAWATTKTGYLVHFTDGKIDFTMFLDRKGNDDGSIKYYSEKELNKDIRQLVKTKYYDYTIKSVKEVTFNHATAYLITIEDAESWKVVHVVNGEAEI